MSDTLLCDSDYESDNHSKRPLARQAPPNRYEPETTLWITFYLQTITST